jgi:type II secretory pathway component PulF
MRHSSTPLPYDIRAILFHQLAVLEHAGIAPHKAYAMLDMPQAKTHINTRIQAMQRLLHNGQPIHQSGQTSGLFTPFEATVIDAACRAGSPEASFRQFAHRYQRYTTQWATLKSRLIMPSMMVLLSILLNPVIALFTGQLSGWGYLWAVAQPLLMMYIVYRVIRHIPIWWSRHTSIQWSRWVCRLPLFGQWYVRQRICDALHNLAMLLAAGVAVFEAVPIAVKTLNDPLLKDCFSGWLPALQHGQTFSQSLRGVADHLYHILGRNSMGQLINLSQTGEHSGALPEVLQRYAEMESTDIAHIQQQMVDWLPRIIYGLLAAWSISDLFSAASSTMVMPDYS